MILKEVSREGLNKPAPAQKPGPQAGQGAPGWRNRVARVFAGAPANELVETQSYFPMSREDAWSRIVFYEEALRPLPWLLRVAVPQPLGVQGEKSGAGALVRCVYREGFLVKHITVMEPPRRLCFRVLDQQLGMEDALRALDGYYELEPLTDGCRVLLATHYRSYLRPRWLWRPIEKGLIMQLHRHILANMQARPSRSSGRQEVSV